ncbi:MAG: hypothetical protein HRT38_11650 [Alteromonadaceae bacterium]|nr:hypothetical protein [Alteromonadaceae bacterium]
MKNSKKHKLNSPESYKQINLVLRLVMSIMLATVITACGGGDGGTTPPPPPANVAPSANAGSDITTDEESAVSLLGSATDTDGSIASYAWSQTAGTTVTLTNADAATASFNAPVTSTQLTLTFQLTATDNDGAIGSDTINVVINSSSTVPPPANIAPSANAGSNITADEETAVSLSGSATDTDGSIASYAWSQTAGTPVTLTDADTATASFNAPITSTQLTLTFQLTATDNDGATSSDTVSITVNPVNELYGAIFVSQNVPATMLPGETVSVSVTMTNSGDSAWTLADDYKLGSQNEQGNTTWGFSRVALTDDVAPGANTTFTFNITAPAIRGTYNFQWRMLEEHVQWFGDFSTNIAINVTNNEASTILLPVEVIGDDYTIVSRTFDLATGASAAELWMQVNNLSYNNKASIKINNGSWTAITNGSVYVQEPERSYGGIGSEVATVRFALASNDFVNGSNTVDFRFNEHNGVSLGYRVVKFNVLDAGGNKLIPESDFINEDPDTWQAPIAGATAITNGKALYESAQLNFPGTNDNMNAKCMDCHLSSGFDLEYFSYSNHSIIERSKFHGLTQAEGEEIASYIRSLAPQRHGRPWNPPYQPGAELNEKPIEQWAAGAGLAAVLDADTDMEPYLFPNGTSQAEVNKVVEFDSVLDATELPIAVQLPDWKSWLPEVHGKDLWPENYFLNGKANKEYVNVTNTLVNGIPAQLIASGSASDLMDSFHAKVKTWLATGRSDDGGRSDSWGTRTGTVIDNRHSEYGLEFTKMNLSKWMAVKFFEFMHEHDLEYLADMHPAVPLVDPIEGTRQWPGKDRTVFEIAPHFTSYNIVNFPWQTKMEGKYMSSVWYQLQMLVHSGEYDQLIKGGPMDWSYHFLHIYDMLREGGPTEGFRSITSLMKLWQSRSNDFVPNDLEKGWRMRYVQLWWMISSDFGDESAMLSLNANDSTLRAKIYNAVINEWVDEVRKIDLATWPRETGNWTKLDPISYTPSEDNITFSNGKIFNGSKQQHADYFLRSIRMLADAGVDPVILRRLAQWCADAWPKGDWFEHIPAVD